MRRSPARGARASRVGTLVASLVLCIALVMPVSAADSVIVFPFAPPAADSSFAWLSTALPLHLKNLFTRLGYTVNVETDPKANPGLDSLSEKELAEWMTSSGNAMAVGGSIQESIGSVRISGSIVTSGGTRNAFDFSAKLPDVPKIILEPGYLASEILRHEPVKKFWQMQMASPQPVLNKLEFDFGPPVSPTAFAQSETFYKTAINVDPNNADAYYQLGTLYAQLKMWENALKNLEEAVHKNPKHLKYHIGLGKAYFLSGRIDDALGEFVQVTILDAGSAEGFYDLSVVYRETGDLEKASVTLEQAQAADPAYANLRFGQAMIEYYHGRRKEAAQQFEYLLMENPKYSSAHNNLGVLALEAGNTADGYRYFQRALAADANNAAALVNVGVTQLGEAKVTEAVAGLNKVKELNPGMPEAAFNLGCALQKAGNLQEALQHYRLAREKDPQNIDVLVNLGVVSYLMGDFMSCQDSLKSASQIDSAPALVFYNLGVFNQAVGQRREALSAYLAASKKRHRMPQIHVNLGLVYEDMKVDSKALTEYLKALALSTELPEVYLYLGLVYSKLGYKDLALETVKKSTLVSFSDPMAYFYLGRLQEVDDRVRAVEAYNTFLQNILRDPNRGPVWKTFVEEKIKSLTY